MKRMIAYAGVLLVLTFGSCKKEGQPLERTLKAATSILTNGATLPQVVNTGDTIILTTCNSYLLDGKCYIDSGAVIIIEKGVVIRAVRQATPGAASALIVTRGGKIFATGTPLQPITFTSAEPGPAVGDWGGVAILGRAPVNKPEPVCEGINPATLPAGIHVAYGGMVANDNSGIFQYVKILYAGASISVNNELNGLTLGGVGSGTTMDHIYVAFSADDAFGIFGGTVNLKYLIARSPNDDCFDFDLGYRGFLQFALSFVNTMDNVFNGNANGIESDNDGMGSPAIPQTRPVISNMTIIGGNCNAVTGTLYGSRWGGNSSMIFRNSIVMGYNRAIQLNNASGDIQCNLLHGFTSITNMPPLPSNNITNTGGCTIPPLWLRNSSGVFCGSLDPRPRFDPVIFGACFDGLPPDATPTIVDYKGAFHPNATTATDWAAFACDNTPCI